MMRFVLLFFSVLFFSSSISADENERIYIDNTVNEYRTYSFSRCIFDNYEKMGVNFNNLSLKDGTLGFIDLDNGLAFSAEPNNELDKFIRLKTGKFYQPKQQSGDLASINLVAYDCMAFYHSKELSEFLKELIQKSKADS